MKEVLWVRRGGVLVVALAALTLGAAALGLAACGGDDESEADGSPAVEAPAEATEAMPEEEPTAAEEAAGDSGEIDACGLLTKEEVEAALGASVGDPVPDPSPPPFYGCSYEAPSPGFEQVSYYVIIWDDEEAALASFQQDIDINDYPEVSGIGDRAYDARPAFGLTVFKGKYELSLDIFSDIEDEAEWAAIKDLAAKAVDRLP